MNRVADDTPYDAIILAGGGSLRMGGVDKPAAVVAGRTLLDRVVDAVAGARRIVVVGPTRSTLRRVEWTREDPVGGGPVAAIAAGLTVLRDADVVVALAGDLPFAGSAVPRLVAALAADAGADGVVLLDGDGREQYLLATYRAPALRRALAHANTANASVRQLIGNLRIVRVSASGKETLDCDTPDDLERARTHAASLEAGRQPTGDGTTRM